MQIKKLKNLTEKAFKNYNGPDEEFNKLNIIFGNNGKGKTSLANGIKKEFLNMPNKDLSKIRFFNNEYIENNLLIIEDTSNQEIKSVIANFGQEEIEIKKEIKNLESKIKVIDPSAEVSKMKIKEEIKTEIDKIFNEKKVIKILKKSLIMKILFYI